MSHNSRNQVIFHVPNLDQSSSLLATRREDIWCQDATDPSWDGQDFSDCARIRYLIAGPALVLGAVIFASYLGPLLWALWSRCLRLSSRKGLSCHSDCLTETGIKSESRGSQAISLAEDRIIAEEVLKEGGLGVDERFRQELLRLSQAHHEGLVKPQAQGNSFMVALFKSLKDVVTTVCSIAITILNLFRFMFESRKDNPTGSALLLFPLVLWLALSLISILKLNVVIRSHRLGKEYPGSLYLSLEIRLIPTYLSLVPFEFLEARSEILRNIENHQSLTGIEKEIFVNRLITVSLLGVIALIELFTPRPTSLLPTNQDRIQPPKITLEQNNVQAPPPLEPRRSLISLAYFTHTDSYLWKHTFKTATQETIPDLRVDDKAAAVMFRWKHDQDEYKRLGIKPSYLRALCWHFRDHLLGQQFFAWFNGVGALLPPFFLQNILSYISSRSNGEQGSSSHVALLYAFGLLATQVFLAFSQSAGLFLGRRLSVRMRALFITQIFSKGLRRDEIGQREPSKKNDEGVEGEKPLDEEAENPASMGKIANLVSNDVFSVSEIGAYLHFLWPESGVQLILASTYLYKLLGYSALAGIFCMLVLLPVQGYFSSIWARYQKKLMKASDKRLGLTSEVINSIKVVKFFAWEGNFLAKMGLLRDAELKVLFQRLVVALAESSVALSIPAIVSVVTFYTHTEVLGKPLRAEEAFTALALFNVVRFPLAVIVGMTSGLLQSYVSLRRIESFLNEPETEKYSTLSVPNVELGDPIIGFKNASFTYQVKTESAEDSISKPENFILRDLDFAFPIGKLSLIIGRGGKTTLLLSLLGETHKISGSAFLPSPVARAWGTDPEVDMSETIAYAPQQPWLLSDTIRNNITYGSLMNKKRYNQVLKACALMPDLATFTDRDLTEIGDKGKTNLHLSGTVLSGGQKARISLARAVYSPAKVLLLDDILSAVDSHTSQHLYEHVLMGPLMKGRTCILVTHAVDLCLKGAEFIVSMDKGNVLFAGKPSLSKSASLIFQSGDLTDQQTKPNLDVTIEDLTDTQLEEDFQQILDNTDRPVNRLVEEERQAVGAVSSTIYKLYYRALGGFFVMFFVLLLFSLAEAGNVASTWVLREWAESNEPKTRENGFIYLKSISHAAFQSSFSHLFSGFLRELSTEGTLQEEKRVFDHIYYIKLYLLASLVTLLFQLLRMMFFTWRSIEAGRKIYDRLINVLLHAQVRFYDTVPIGRVLNRLSKDVQTMDRELGDSLSYMANDILSAIAILGIVVFVLPVQFTVAALGACSLYFLIGHMYLASTREIKRSESTSRSPVISLCTECLGGVSSIRAYGDVGRYTQMMFRLIDSYNRPYFMLWLCNRWLSSRIDVAAAIFTFSVAVWMIKSNISAALSGFALTYVISFNFKTLWIVRWWSVNEINLNCLERIHEYLGIGQEPSGGSKPPAAWPSKQGTIEVENLTARYAPHLPPVLKSVSFSVKPGEKIGICGRTGSGKSTLALSFFRFIEAEEGRIMIDGLDISKLQLSSLRSRLTIIPQESVLFAATIRWNMDPFSEHDDNQIWDALRRVGMAAPSIESSLNSNCSSQNLSPSTLTQREISFITSLDTEVQDGGRNFSLGQRQLLAIARAILKLQESSVLILDESTASLDAESDEKIQSTIRSEMEGSTILCIAHRLKTIIDYDKVLVLGDGRVLEFDSPSALLDKEDSVFKQLCEKSGNFEELKEMVAKLKK
ncbi:hypothetical protein BY996DRAFT_4577718 [Phakopsora pachyrhizi]|uniref:ATP-binding cassette transporter n=1 Tax=Phakopsora pachyrhizi TaxID=170000 RepID=A0AAV0BRK9_PHAPC|nr:hypothetical protein BY996DRAFT_4577718 [Phakopsora pachyrhizi]CAH7688816.1 hypothetical protein PPACK8108_LOCUS23849 [Phakopsora pachyrhizi]